MATGSVAAMIYGEPRLTNGIELIVVLRPDDAGTFAAAYAGTDLHVPPVEVIAEEAARTSGGHFNVIHGASGLKADFYVAGDDSLHRWALSRLREVEAFGHPLRIAPPEYVVLRKLEYYRAGGSEKHLRDVRRMLAVSGDSVDVASIDQWALRLGVAEEWRVARSSGERQA
jgi:hypothetical protein